MLGSHFVIPICVLRFVRDLCLKIIKVTLVVGPRYGENRSVSAHGYLINVRAVKCSVDLYYLYLETNYSSCVHDGARNLTKLLRKGYREESCLTLWCDQGRTKEILLE